MENNDNIERKKHKIDKSITYSEHSKFSLKNCICCFWISTPHTSFQVQYVHVAFYEEMDNKKFIETKVVGFNPMGIDVIYCKPENSTLIVEEIKRSHHLS